MARRAAIVIGVAAARVMMLCLLSSALAFLLIPTAAGAAVFSNTTPINIPGSGTGGPGSPYPSTIAVTDLAGTVVKARVTFDIRHQDGDNIDALLVGPGGQQSTLMSDVLAGSVPSSVAPCIPGSLTLIFDDDASATVPNTPICNQPGARLPAYRATDGGAIADNYPAPAPGPPRSAALSNFEGTAPNGDWRLFVHDDTTPATGVLSDWSLELLTTGPGGGGGDGGGDGGDGGGGGDGGSDDGGPDANDFSFGKVKKNKRKGTAKLTVNVPDAGELDLAKTKKVKADDEPAEDAGKEKLAIKPKGKAKKKLNDKGKAKVKAHVTYTPDGGSPNTEVKKIKLVKR